MAEVEKGGSIYIYTRDVVHMYVNKMASVNIIVYVDITLAPC